MLRSKADEIETVNALNETAKIMLPKLDETGIRLIMFNINVKKL